MLTQLSLQQYIDKLSSSHPTPGGGSALANVACQGVALIAMSCSVTIAKLTRQGKDIPLQLATVSDQLQPYMQQLLTLVDSDAQCFDNIITAMRMPKDTAHNIQLRTQQLQSAYITSAVTCIQLTTICAHCYHLADIAIALSDQYVVSDAHIGKALMHTCATNSTHNIYANTSYIKDTTIRQQLEGDTTALLAMLD